MFHVIVAVCVAAASGQCAEMLLPKGDSASLPECRAGAGAIAADWLADRPDLTGGAVTCRANADLPALELRELAPGVFAHPGAVGQMEDVPDGRIANLGVVIGDASVAVIDAGVGRAQGQALHVAIRRLTDLPIGHVILTHMHPDHVLGAAVMAEAGARIVGHHALSQALQGRGDSYLASLRDLYPPAEWVGTQVSLPDDAVADVAAIDLGGRSLMLRAWPPAHTDSDLTVLDSASGTLFAGDLLFRGLTPVLDGSLAGWLDWMAGDPAAGAVRIVPGHGDISESWADAVGPQQAFLTALAQETRAAIDAGLAMSQAVPVIAAALQPFAERWKSFDATVARNATTAYKELEWD